MCTDFNIRTLQEEPLTTYDVEYDAEYECYARGG